MVVYTDMFLNVMQQYPSLGNWRELSFTEIRYFYDGMRYQLKKATRSRG